MYGKLQILVLVLLLTTAYTETKALSAETDLTVNAAEYICAKAREGKKTRLAVYTFTNDAGDTSAETKGYSTKIMALILDKKEFKVIDPESVKEVINEQEKGLTGLIDPETAAETGKITGADALIFGISGSGSLQVRIIDAATGEVIGATLEVAGGKTRISNDDYKSPESKNPFMAAEFKRNLRLIYNKQPMLYLYITANETEAAELDKTFPGAMNRLRQKITDKDHQRLEYRKKRLADFMNTNPEFDKSIRQSREELIEQLQKKKENRKGKKNQK